MSVKFVPLVNKCHSLMLDSKNKYKNEFIAIETCYTMSAQNDTEQHPFVNQISKGTF